MKTRRRIGTSLVFELTSYTILAALHLWGGEAAVIPYGLLVVAVSLRIYRQFRSKRKNRSDSHDSVKA